MALAPRGASIRWNPSTMTLPFRPDPPARAAARSRLQDALAAMLRQQPDATRAPVAIPPHLTRSRGVMRETPQGPSALPLPNATPASQERGVDTGSRAIMGLVDASDAVLEGGQAVRAAREGRFRNAIAHALLAAAPVASSTSVRQVGDVIGDAFRGLREGPLAGTRVVDEAGMPKRVYHGTSAAFETFDTNRLDPNALYGPGIYHTENPLVAGGDGAAAGGYSRKAGDGLRTKSDHEIRQAADAELAEAAEFRRTASEQTDPQGRAFWEHAATVREQEANRMLGDLAKPMYAPNVRPARLAIRSPFEIDREYDRAEINSIVRMALKEAGGDASKENTLRLTDQIIARNGAQKMVERGEASGAQGTSSGENLYRALTSWVFPGNQAGVNAALRRAGYDGITHIGGANTGTDPHKVWIAFDRSQVRSAFDPPETARQVGAALLTTGAGAAALSQSFNRERERRKDK